MADIRSEGAPPEESGPGRLRRFRWPIVFLSLTAIFATAPAYVGTTQWQRVAKVQDGVRAVGVFHAESSNCWSQRCWVEFEIDGKRVEADLPALTSEGRRRASREGRPITIRYLASDPMVAAEEDGFGYVVAVTAALSMPAGIMLIFGLGTLGAALRGRPPFAPWSS
ncbi:hypothetical protein [Streptomyces viridochromogenes]|uniref:hypothetical protein n=1 Tax=Streptomyces viridochromogenes TaxID=1938 RepID=UPI00065C8820|nr:hypothetical protein [Streptomyces viridochromogenes]